MIFTLDIAVRLVIAPNRLEFLKNPVVVIEIIAVIPYFVDVGVHIADAIQIQQADELLALIHVLRIFGVLRVFKILRYYSGLQVLVYTLRSSCKDLLLMLTFIGVACLFFSSLIYFVDDRKVFTSIPRGFWWSIITMTTVGYGDLVPTTIGGYIVGSCCALVGVLVVAFTVPILVNSFMLYYSHAQSIIPYKREATKSYKQASTRAYLEHSLQALKRISLRPLRLEPDFPKSTTTAPSEPHPPPRSTSLESSSGLTRHPTLRLLRRQGSTRPSTGTPAVVSNDQQHEDTKVPFCSSEDTLASETDDEDGYSEEEYTDCHPLQPSVSFQNAFHRDV